MEATGNILHLGMTLFESGFQVGTLDPSSQHAEILMEDLLEMSIQPDRIVLGDECAEYPDRINIYDLISEELNNKKSESSPNMSQVQLIQIFLKEIKRRILLKKPHTKEINVAIATQWDARFANCNLGVAAIAAGFEKVRVLQCAVATAIACTRLGLSHDTHVVIIQYFKHSFALAIVRIMSDSVKEVLTLNFTDKTLLFRCLHGHLAGGGRLSADQFQQVSTTYKLAADTLYSIKAETNNTAGVKTARLYTSQWKGPIDNIISKFFAAKRLQVGNPSLIGACIVSENVDSSSAIDSDFEGEKPLYTVKLSDNEVPKIKNEYRLPAQISGKLVHFVWTS